jgi:hypothetical protein
MLDTAPVTAAIIPLIPAAFGKPYLPYSTAHIMPSCDCAFSISISQRVQ